MKKVLLTGAAMIAFAAASFAQGNTATLNQNGNAQTASQQQTGNYLQSTIVQDQTTSTNFGNFAATRQQSTGAAGNQATIRQTRGTNSSRGYVTQLGGTGNIGNIAQDNQSGNSSSSLQVMAGTASADVIGAGGNWAGIYQQGSGNTNTFMSQVNVSMGNFGEITQYANNSRQTSIDQSNYSFRNKATIQQGSEGKPVSANEAIISQKFNSGDNQVSVEQTNTGNIAYVEQHEDAYSNQANIKQLPGSNGYESAYVYQSNASHGNKSAVTQAGFGDFVYVHQDNQSYNNSAIAKQGTNDFTSGSTVSINQQNGSHYDQATVTQDGVNDQATVNQQDASDNNQATITQRGKQLQATINQLNANVNQATINQKGNNNLATISESLANKNQATINQNLVRTDGGGNTAELLQGDGTSANYASNSTATINQDYSHNTAKLKQYGDANVATLTQMIGDNNIIKGLGNDPYARQQGVGNTLTVTQDSGLQGSPGGYVPNTANVSQIGNNNTSTIMQTGHN